MPHGILARSSLDRLVLQRPYCHHWVVRVLPVAMLAGLVCCSGPQPLSLAIDPREEAAYVDQLNAVNGDASAAFLNWVAPQRGATATDMRIADEKLSTTRNPFDAHKDARAVGRGAVIYKLHCARCHGEDARGRGPSALQGHPANDFHSFGQRFASTLHRGAPRRWFRSITEGYGDEVEYPDGKSRAMPPFKEKLAREQIWLVIAYLQSLDMHAPKTRSEPQPY